MMEEVYFLTGAISFVHKNKIRICKKGQAGKRKRAIEIEYSPINYVKVCTASNVASPYQPPGKPASRQRRRPQQRRGPFHQIFCR